MVCLSPSHRKRSEKNHQMFAQKWTNYIVTWQGKASWNEAVKMSLKWNVLRPSKFWKPVQHTKKTILPVVLFTSYHNIDEIFTLPEWIHHLLVCIRMPKDRIEALFSTTWKIVLFIHGFVVLEFLQLAFSHIIFIDQSLWLVMKIYN